MPDTIMLCSVANSVAEINNAGDDEGWRYTVVPAKPGYARVAVYDETNTFVGYL